MNNYQFSISELRQEFGDMDAERALLAIAERLEALVEVKKPRWVVFEWYTESATPDGKFAINANDVREVSEVVSGGTITHCEITLKSEDILHYVKGTLAEVMAKLRGEV